MSKDPPPPDTISVPVPSPFAREWSVVALRERATGRCHEVGLEPRRYVLGKSPSCDLVIDDPYVSGVHCVLVRGADGSLRVRDSSSRNGSFVDGNPIVEVELRPGAVLLVGRTYLVAVGDRNPASALDQLRGRDPAFRAAVQLAQRAARSDCSVLIVGETGTGKDLVARVIHEASARAYQAFIPVNCGAIPRELIGSELFGHRRGAFTGAIEAHDGVFVAADGGTLFLDELGELPIELQPNLLRVLESGRVRPVGAVEERALDVRVVAATNRLDGLGTDGSPVRLDLYHRLASVTIELPPLRARKDDIPELAEGFLTDLIPRHGARTFLPEAIDAMLAYDWPGNVRELRQTIVRAVSLSDEDIGLTELGIGRALQQQSAVRRGTTAHAALGDDAIGPRDVVGDVGIGRHEAVVKEMMVHALARRGTIRAAARELGMPKSTFAERARRYGLYVPSTKKRPR